MITWIKKHFSKIIIALLVLVVLVLGASYLDLKNQKSISFTAPQNQEVANTPPPVVTPVVEEPTVDTIPPKIQSYCFSPTLKKFEELVCIRIDSWNGYLDSTNSVPITGSIQGDIKSITVDGKKITWDENKQIYQRINLYIYGGLNKYKVVVEDMAGNKATGYVETDAQNTDNDYDLNINE